MQPIELQARREALGLSQVSLATLLAVTQATVSRWESGKAPIPAGVDGELIEMEEALEDLLLLMAERWETDPSRNVEIEVYATDESMWAAHPHLDGLPAVLYRVAMARARMEANDPNAVRLVEG